MMGYSLWAGMQVPLFVLVQSFHSLKKENCSFRLKKVLWRVLAPFIFVEVILFFFLLMVHANIYNVKGLAVSFVCGGGIGPGSYYPWIYLQIALILPFCCKLVRRLSKLQLTVLFIFVCEGFEIISSLIDLPEYLHRLLALRYLFLIFLAWIWVKDGIVINMKTISLSLLIAVAIIYFDYFSVDDEPWFYNTLWASHRWPCYAYVALALGG